MLNMGGLQLPAPRLLLGRSPPPGALQLPAHLAGGPSFSAPNSGGGRAITPWLFNKRVAYSEVVMMVTALASAADAAVYFHLRESGDDDRPGKVVADWGQRLVGTGQTVGFNKVDIAWTPPDENVVMWLDTAWNAKSQATMARVASALPNWIFASNFSAGEWSAAATNGMRYYTSTDAFGPLAIGSLPTGLATSNGSDGIFPFLRRAP